MAKYSKLVVSVIGLIAVILGPEILGLANQTELLTQSVLGLLTAFGVYQIPNRESAHGTND